jgi:hypothetical protein
MLPKLIVETIDVQMGQIRRAARHTTLKHTTRTRHDTMFIVSVPARHDGWAVSGPRSRHAVLARTRHEKSAHLNTKVAHLNTTRPM